MVFILTLNYKNLQSTMKDDVEAKKEHELEGTKENR